MSVMASIMTFGFEAGTFIIILGLFACRSQYSFFGTMCLRPQYPHIFCLPYGFGSDVGN
jgi:hypothetical protein